MTTRHVVADLLTGLVHCLIGSALAGLASSGVLVVVVLALT